tara:strand:+ start:1293 stop:1478 length:186 start_codon:yes stop_codon:yes gene_type:complete
MDVSDIDDETLLRRAVENARPRQRRSPRWVVVMDLFGLGSTYAHQLCARFDLNPDDEVKVK